MDLQYDFLKCAGEKSITKEFKNGCNPCFLH